MLQHTAQGQKRLICAVREIEWEGFTCSSCQQVHAGENNIPHFGVIDPVCGEVGLGDTWLREAGGHRLCHFTISGVVCERSKL